MGRRSHSRDHRDHRDHRDRGRSRDRDRDYGRRRRRSSSSSSDSDRDDRRRRRRREQEDSHRSSSRHSTSYHDHRSSSANAILPTPGSHRPRTSSLTSPDISLLTATPQPYSIPSSAPRVQVPANLPVEVTSFLDLFALFVSRGGPAFEEEIRQREKSNHFFAFLSRPWNDPMNLYYRWRLCALLQEGSSRQLMRWSTEPFQLEQGPQSVVWVPPPEIRSGVEHLSYLCDEVTSPSSLDTPLMSIIEQSQRTSALWISRLVTNEETFFVALTGAQLQTFKTMMSTDAMWEINDASTSSSSPTSSADSEQSLYDKLALFQSKVLAAAYIADRTCFVVEKGDAAAHCVAVIIDELVRLTAAIVGTCETDRWKQEDPTVQKSAAENVSSAGVRSGAEQHVMRWILGVLSCLFQLHDVCRNSASAPVSEEELESALDAEEVSHSPTTATATAAAGLPTRPVLEGVRNRNTLVRVLEWSLPTIVESALRIVMSVVSATSSGASSAGVDGCTVTIANRPKDSLTDDGSSQPIDFNAALTHQQRAALTAALRDGSNADLQGRICGSLRLTVFELASWVRSLITEWGDAGLIGTRCWLKLQSNYAFFFARDIETVSGP